MALGKHDLIEAEIAQTLNPAKRILMLFVALQEVLIPRLTLHVVLIGLNDEFLVITQLEIHCVLLFRRPVPSNFCFAPASHRGSSPGLAKAISNPRRSQRWDNSLVDTP